MTQHSAKGQSGEGHARSRVHAAAQGARALLEAGVADERGGGRRARANQRGGEEGHPVAGQPQQAPQGDMQGQRRKRRDGGGKNVSAAPQRAAQAARGENGGHDHGEEHEADTRLRQGAKGSIGRVQGVPDNAFQPVRAIPGGHGEQNGDGRDGQRQTQIPAHDGSAGHEDENRARRGQRHRAMMAARQHEQGQKGQTRQARQSAGQHFEQPGGFIRQGALAGLLRRLPGGAARPQEQPGMPQQEYGNGQLRPIRPAAQPDQAPQGDGGGHGVFHPHPGAAARHHERGGGDEQQIDGQHPEIGRAGADQERHGVCADDPQRGQQRPVHQRQRQRPQRGRRQQKEGRPGAEEAIARMSGVDGGVKAGDARRCEAAGDIGGIAPVQAEARIVAAQVFARRQQRQREQNP